METICLSEGSMMSYPDVVWGGARWAWSDARPGDGKEVITVTVHGLRRLLRIASLAWPFAAHLLYSGNPGYDADPIYAEKVNMARAAELANELSSIWCEGNLVMSRLFVSEDGKAIVHPDKEVDDKSKFPWEL